MTRVPTVRVRNPSTGSYKTINVADLDDQHEVWHEQGDDFDPVALERARSKPVDPAVRDAASSLALRVASLHTEQQGGNFSAMTDVEKLQVLEEMSERLDRDVVSYREFARERRARRDADEAAAREDAALEASRLSDQASQLAGQAAGQETPAQAQDTSGEGLGIQPDQSGAPDDQPDLDEPGKTVDHPMDGTLYVEESARGKFYVSRSGKRVSRGLPTREEADRLKASMESQS